MRKKKISKSRLMQIDDILSLLESYWKTNPRLRLCEALYKIARQGGDTRDDLFYLEDKFVKKVLDDWVFDTVPVDWDQYHHSDCGIRYRGCHPTHCPKDQYEKTGEWEYPLIEKDKEV